MVKVYMRSTRKEIPLQDIVSKGFNQFFTEISETESEFNEYKDMSRYCVLYCGTVLKEEQIKDLSDKDAIRVTIAPESKIKKTDPIDPAYKADIDRQIKVIVQPFQNDGRRVPDLHRAFVQPSFVRKLREAIPELQQDMNLFDIMHDYYLFRAYFVRDEYKADPERNEFKYRIPNIIDILKRFTKFVVASLGMRLIENPLPIQRQQAAPTVTPTLLQNALAAALNQQPPPAAPPAAPSAGPSSSSAPPPQPAPQQQDEPMQEGYEAQAATLRSFGFEDEELIQLALEQANGDIQAAMEFLIEINN